MSDSIIKDWAVQTVSGSTEIPGTPYVPAQPARTVYENRTVCGNWYDGVPGHYVYTAGAGGASVGMVFVPDTPFTGAGGSIRSVYACRTVNVPVTYPAVPAVAAVPARSAAYSYTVPSANIGWNAGGRSAAIFTADGYVQFSVRASTVGAIVGMNLYDGTDAHYSGATTDYGFLLTHGIARIIENGVIGLNVGNFDDTTVFRITRSGTTITYAMNGTTVKTTTGAPTTSGWLEAALYSAGDEVFTPSVTQVSAPDTSSLGSTLSITLPPLTTLFARSDYAELKLNLPPITEGFVMGGISPAYAVLNISLPPLAAAINGLTGEDAQLAITLPPVAELFADHPYGALNVTLPKVSAYAATGDPSFASMAIPMQLSFPLIGTSTSDASFGDRIQFNVPMTATAVDDVHMTDRLRFAVNMTSTGDDTVIFHDTFLIAVPLIEPDADADVWAVNLDGTTFGSTHYSNYAFNSFALIGNGLYGAKSDGVFSLSGSTDNGAPIRAVLSPGKLDFGSPEKKTVSEVDLMLACEGVMTLRAIALDSQGEEAEYLYSTTRPSSDLREARIKTGKGLRSNQHYFELYNENGADFELAAMQFIVADLKRKI